MANKSLFKSWRGTKAQAVNAQNEAGGTAYAFDPRHALAQYAATGCLASTFYADAAMQLDTVRQICARVEPEFIARAALFARGMGLMKDLPALLCAELSLRGPGLLAEIFERVIDSPKMLRNFVQIMRSGAVGRRSLGTLPKRLILQWLEQRTNDQLFSGSVGKAPSLADVIRMVHPKPATPDREALFGWLIGRPHNGEALPASVQEFEAFKLAPATAAVPNVPFQMLTSLELPPAVWKTIARNASWQTTRMNLNTFARHGVFEDAEVTALIANRLRDAAQIRRTRPFPYQLLVAYHATNAAVPVEVRESLQHAMEIAIEGVPALEGRVCVFPDVSGSMSSPVTGVRKGATSAVRCIDVAALVSAAILRANPSAVIVLFEQDVVSTTRLKLNPRDSVMTNAALLASIGGGGTNCSAPLKWINRKSIRADLVVYVSDNQSWVDSSVASGATETMQQWNQFKRHNPGARMVCIDLQPYGTTQAVERADVFNVGGFSDQVFEFLAAVAGGRAAAGHWVSEIEGTRL